MSQWVISGLRTGIKSGRYPRVKEIAPGTVPGLPGATPLPAERAQAIAARCPTGALDAANGGANVDLRRCINCFRCVRNTDAPMNWDYDYECAVLPADGNGDASRLGPAFGGSAHILVVDAGDCGACLNEVKQLNNPYYNMHRLGFFFTPTPRDADILMVVGPVTVHMRLPLLKAYNAMPTPKRVIAVGACALSGGTFGPSFISGAGVSDVLPVDVEIPGNPPPPLAILHGLLVAVGRRPSALLISTEGTGKEVKTS